VTTRQPYEAPDADAFPIEEPPPVVSAKTLAFNRRFAAALAACQSTPGRTRRVAYYRGESAAARALRAVRERDLLPGCWTLAHRLPDGSGSCIWAKYVHASYIQPDEDDEPDEPDVDIHQARRNAAAEAAFGSIERDHPTYRPPTEENPAA
jgi:hypothetical protein